MNLLLRIELVTAGQLALDCRLVTIKLKRVDPAHPVFGSGEQLKSSIGNAAGLAKLFSELN